MAVCSDSSHPPRERTLARHSGSTSDSRPKRTVRDQHYFAAKCSKRGAVCKRSWRLFRSNSKAKAPRAKNKSKLGLGSCMARTQLVSTDRGAAPIDARMPNRSAVKRLLAVRPPMNKLAMAPANRPRIIVDEHASL